MAEQSIGDGLSTADRQALRYADRSDVRPVVDALRASRTRILQRWLESVAIQPFHLGRPERAVSDDIPVLFDAVVDVIAESSAREAPMESERVTTAVRSHASTRSAQGLLPADVVLEVRLLRQEVLYALREDLSESASLSDVLGTQLLLSDALDGAIGIAVDHFITELEEAKDDFVAIAAHDLRTPLTVLKGTIQLLQRQARLGTVNRELLSASLSGAEAEAARMEQLLSNLLDLTSVRSGMLEVHPESSNLRLAVEHVVGRLSPEAAARIVIEDDGDDLSGRWETSRIEQIVENLLSNALKYAPEGPVRVHLARRETNALLEVRDQGIGLSAEDRAQLFRRFYRSPEVVRRKVAGTGLGLYICRGIIEAHGGQIRITSPGRGQGTTVEVLLPLRKRAN